MHGLTHANGGKKLYENSELRLNKDEHIALIGPNGAGKTTLLNIIAQKIVPDHGEVEIHPKTKIGYLDQHQDVNGEQTVEEYLKLSFQELYDLEKKMHDIYAKMAEEYDEDELVKALKYQDILNVNDFETIDKKIGNLVTGLGIGNDKLAMPMGSLSGGQRGKVMLAKLLLSGNDFLLLDEPTNFLDIEQVEWLAKFLQNFDKAFLMVSHDNEFINKTCKIIYAIENLHLTRYVGNYEKYLEESAMLKLQHEKAVASQQQQVDKLKTYIAKNSARASTAKSAQSRQKQLEKMDLLKDWNEDAKPHFNFTYKRPSTSVVVKAKDLAIGYDHALLSELNFEIREGEKCIISGRNGIGKTTLLKTMCTEIDAFSGTIELGHNVSYAYFHQIEEMEPITPIQYLLNHHDKITEADAKAKLAQFGVRKQLMFQAMNTLSGGEQSKVRLSSLSLEPCSLLVLDEPTNHIDVKAKDALLEAIQAFKGTVLLTTQTQMISTFVQNIVNNTKKNRG
jgi:ATPase subunit of ABC transporter with duplicated ATPase domains